MSKPLIPRRDSIITTTIEVINEFGIQGISTREVARREGVSEGTIFKHYPKKNDLIIGVLKYFSQFDYDIMISANQHKPDISKALKFFYNAYAEYYQNYPEIVSISQSYDMLCSNTDFVEIINEIVTSRKKYIVQLINEGVSNGEFSQSINTNNIADVCIGTFRYKCLQWRLKKYEFSLKDEVNSFIAWIINNITEGA